MKLKIVIGGLILILALVLIGCSSQSASPPPTQPASSAPTASAAQASPGQLSVTILNFSFNPQTITVSPGTKVTWTNKDSTNHTVTSDTNLFDGGPLNPGDTFSFTFNQTGNFGYHCKIHPSMTGTIIVK